MGSGRIALALSLDHGQTGSNPSFPKCAPFCGNGSEGDTDDIKFRVQALLNSEGCIYRRSDLQRICERSSVCQAPA